MTLDPLSIMLGWAGCILFVAVWELISRLTAARRTRRRFEQLLADPMAKAHGDCPWPIDAKFPHRLSGVPKSNAATRECGADSARAGGGFVRRHHQKSYSRFSIGGSSEGSF